MQGTGGRCSIFASCWRSSSGLLYPGGESPENLFIKFVTILSRFQLIYSIGVGAVVIMADRGGKVRPDLSGRALFCRITVPTFNL